MKYSNTDIERIIIAQEEKSPGEMLKFLKNELLESVGSYYLDYKRYKREGESLIVKAEKYLEKNEDMEVNEKLSFGTNLLLSNAPEVIAENFIKFIDIPEDSKPGHYTASNPMRFSDRGMSDITGLGLDHICGIPTRGLEGTFSGIDLKRDNYYPLGVRITNVSSNTVKLIGFKIARHSKDDYGYRGSYREDHESALHDGNIHNYRDVLLKETEPRYVTSKSEALELMKELQKKYEDGMEVVGKTRSFTNIVSGVIKGILRKGFDLITLGLSRVSAEAPYVFPLAGFWLRFTDPIMHNTHFKELANAQKELCDIITKR